jgi:hypothetical protein
VSGAPRNDPSNGRELLEAVQGSYPVGRACHASHWARCVIGCSIAARCSHRAGRVQPRVCGGSGIFPGWTPCSRASTFVTPGVVPSADLVVADPLALTLSEMNRTQRRRSASHTADPAGTRTRHLVRCRARMFVLWSGPTIIPTGLSTAGSGDSVEQQVLIARQVSLSFRANPLQRGRKELPC